MRVRGGQVWGPGHTGVPARLGRAGTAGQGAFCPPRGGKGKLPLSPPCSPPPPPLPESLLLKYSNDFRCGAGEGEAEIPSGDERAADNEAAKSPALPPPAWPGEAWHGSAQLSTARHGTARHSMAWHGTIWHGTIQHGTARHGTIWHGTIRHGTALHGPAPCTSVSPACALSPRAGCSEPPLPLILQPKPPAAPQTPPAAAREPPAPPGCAPAPGTNPKASPPGSWREPPQPARGIGHPQIPGMGAPQEPVPQDPWTGHPGVLRKGHPALQPLAEPTGTHGDSGMVTAGVPLSHPTRVGITNPHPGVPPAGHGALGMEGGSWGHSDVPATCPPRGSVLGEEREQGQGEGGR
ncbi:protein transport protein SEC31-like [Oxyura jamaicensis]|uniref:protein transport protein SEC31-like n=1 Tax=Oxyura jamaicensis TaxID=8884 RepID=UPI0015A527FE|nr:protein transport protein SEC31-like [Oxyura jamaicensis]